MSYTADARDGLALALATPACHIPPRKNPDVTLQRSNVFAFHG